MLFVFIGASADPIVAQADVAEATAIGTSETLSSMGVGAVSSSGIPRKGVVAAIFLRADSGGDPIGDPTVTIGGVSATKLCGGAQSGSTRAYAALYFAPLRTGTTADVAMSFNKSLTSCAVVTYAKYGGRVDGVYATDQDLVIADSLSVSAANLGNAAAIAAAMAPGAPNNSFTWTSSDVSEDVDAIETVEDFGYTTASGNALAAGTVTAAAEHPFWQSFGCLAVWR